MSERIYKPGDCVVHSIGEHHIYTNDTDVETVIGAMMTFPAGPHPGMTFGDIWSKRLFRLVPADETPSPGQTSAGLHPQQCSPVALVAGEDGNG